MRHGRSQGGIVVQHEYADVFRFVDVPACAPCPVAKLEAPDCRCDRALRRFVLRRVGVQELPFRRMECAPGQEAQVDFGQAAWVVENGKRRRPHLFRVVLSHSRKGYSEAVWRQTAESFLRCLENAFRHFGGVTVSVVIDNLKAGVLQADWFDPELNPKLEEFARFYGTVILPTQPAMPRHKGRSRRG